MTLASVEVGKVYYAKVSGKVVPCRVDSINDEGRTRKKITCTNLQTKRKLVVSAARLRFQVKALLTEDGICPQ